MAKSELEKLQKVWYKKLKDTGFKDMEDPNGPRNGGRGAPRVDNITDMQQEMIREYYSRARQFLQEHTFEDAVDRFVWEHFSEGTSVREISIKLEKELNVIKKKTAVWQIAKRLEELMKQQYNDFGN